MKSFKKSIILVIVIAIIIAPMILAINYEEESGIDPIAKVLLQVKLFLFFKII